MVETLRAPEPVTPVLVAPPKKKVTRSKPKLVKAPRGEPEAVAGPKRVARKLDIEALQIEKAVLHPNLSVREYLLTIKEFTPKQYSKYMEWAPLASWDAQRERLQNQITAGLLSRHVDAAAQVQDLFLNTTRLGITRVLEMLSKWPVTSLPEYVMMPDPADLTGKTLKAVRKTSLRSIDVLNCLGALKHAQDIYRRAMGLTDDSDSIAAIIEQFRGGTSITLNQQINVAAGGSTLSAEARTKVEAMSYDDVFVLIEAKREMRVKALAAGDAPSLGDVIIHTGAADED